jgi:hypothetical protein
MLIGGVILFAKLLQNSIKNCTSPLTLKQTLCCRRSCKPSCQPLFAVFLIERLQDHMTTSNDGILFVSFVADKKLRPVMSFMQIPSLPPQIQKHF